MANLHNQMLPAGTRLGVYEIKEIIKSDNFGISYHGWNHHLKEWVDIQEYLPSDLAIRAANGLDVEVKSPSEREKFDYGFKAFLEQGEILTQIEHPNIVRTENILRLNGTAYLVSSQHEGLALAQAAKAPSSLADAELTYILESLLSALQKVYEHNMAHCGIQPDTIFLKRDGAALLSGFNGARLTLAEQMAKPESVLVTGYAAPELYRPGSRPSPASDFYALGASLYHCIFHKPLPASQDRLKALSKGEADPLSFSDSAASQYSPTLLRAISWMLRPGYNDRPQSAAEILAQLKPAAAADQNGTAAQHDAKARATGLSTAINPIWLAAAGFAGVVIIGFWLSKKSPELEVNGANTPANQPLSQGDQNRVTENAQADNPAPLATAAQPNQTIAPEIKPNPPIAGSKPVDEEPPQPAQTDNSPSQPDNAAKNAALPISQPVVEQAIKAQAAAAEERANKPTTTNTKQTTHRLKKLKSSEPPIHADSIQSSLGAARKAMKEVRFTTPPGNNAYHYYQQVLAKDPGNREALVGKQRIVKRYAWFIRKSKADGEIGRAERVLKKAESVSPDDPQLRQLREELQNQ